METAKLLPSFSKKKKCVPYSSKGWPWKLSWTRWTFVLVNDDENHNSMLQQSFRAQVTSLLVQLLLWFLQNAVSLYLAYFALVQASPDVGFFRVQAWPDVDRHNSKNGKGKFYLKNWTIDNFVSYAKLGVVFLRFTCKFAPCNEFGQSNHQSMTHSAFTNHQCPKSCRQDVGGGGGGEADGSRQHGGSW